MSDFAKGSAPKDASYAKGGAKLGRERSFLKEPDEFRYDPQPPKPDSGNENFTKTGKGGKLSKLTGDKCLPTIKPKS